MVYYAKTQRLILFNLFLLLMLTTMLVGFEARWTLFVFIPFAVFIFSTIFIGYTFEILQDTLVFQVRLFGVKIYRKEMDIHTISSIKFKRVGWGKHCGIIKNHTGFNVRIVDFYPKEVFNDLLNFANHYDIPVVLTKEYTIIKNRTLKS